MTRLSSKGMRVSSVREAGHRQICRIHFHLYDVLEKQKAWTENISGTKSEALVRKGSKATRAISLLCLQQLRALSVCSCQNSLMGCLRTIMLIMQMA